jgi:hypothetical protein
VVEVRVVHGLILQVATEAQIVVEVAAVVHTIMQQIKVETAEVE